MKTTQDRNRKFEKADGRVLEQGQVFHGNFVKDKTVFIAKVPMFADPFADDFQVAITTADAIPLDSEIKGEIEVLTEDLKKEMGVGQKAFQELMYYLKLAFPGSDAVHSAFGHNKYDKVRASQTELPNLLEQANRKADDPKYKTGLIAQGFTQAMIDNLQTVQISIHDKNQVQEDAMSDRLVKTKERVEALNLVWEYMEKISEASKLIYIDNPTKKEQYLLYPEGRYAKKNTEEEEE